MLAPEVAMEMFEYSCLLRDLQQLSAQGLHLVAKEFASAWAKVSELYLMRFFVTLCFLFLPFVHLQLAPLGYGLLHRVRSLERDLCSSQEGKEKLQAEMRMLAEELQKRGEALEHKEAELTTAHRLRVNAERQKELMEKSMSTVMAGHKAEKEALEIRLKAAVDEYKASAALAEKLLQPWLSS